MTHPFKTHEGSPLHRYTCSFNLNDFTINLQFSSGVCSKLELENGGGGVDVSKFLRSRKKRLWLWLCITLLTLQKSDPLARFRRRCIQCNEVDNLFYSREGIWLLLNSIKGITGFRKTRIQSICRKKNKMIGMQESICQIYHYIFVY